MKTGDLMTKVFDNLSVTVAYGEDLAKRAFKILDEFTVYSNEYAKFKYYSVSLS